MPLFLTEIFYFFSTGAGAEEGPEAAYGREEELELARKGSENVFDPEGILDDDEDMEISTDDKETQTGNLSVDVKDYATQGNLRAVVKSAGSQTGRRLQKMSMDDPDLIRSGHYLSIRAGRKAADITTAIGSTGRGEGVRMKVEQGGFCYARDRRILKTTIRYRADEMMVVSCSFEPGSMTCTNCEQRGKHSVVNSIEGGPVVFIGTDQHFPAVLPSLDEGSCMSIVRVEDGGIRDIAWMIIDILSGISLPPRSTVLIGSASRISAKGIQTYGEDMAWSIRVLREKLGEGLTVSALVPILINGVNNPSLVRGVAEAECGFEGLVGPDGALMRRTRAVLLQEMERQGRGLVLAPEENMVCMPDRLVEFNRVPIALMGWRTMAEQLAPFPQEAEERMVMSMRDELEANFGVKVSRNLDLRRAETGAGAADYVIIGGSNGGNLGAILKKKGRSVIDLTEKGFRIKKGTAEKLEKQIVDSVTEDMVVICMATDSSHYFCEDEEGAR